jgi:hypothetical protein
MKLPIPFVSPEEWTTRRTDLSSLYGHKPDLYEIRCGCVNANLNPCHCEYGCSCHYKKEVGGIAVSIDILYAGWLPIYTMGLTPVLTFVGHSWIVHPDPDKRLAVMMYDEEFDGIPQSILENGISQYTEMFNEKPSLILCCCRDARNPYVYGLALFGKQLCWPSEEP